MKNIYRILFFITAFSSSAFAQQSNSGNYFPIAVWLQNPENALRYNKEGGINMYVGLWTPLDEKQFDLLKSVPIKLICEQNDFGLAHQSEPMIYGWMQGDEPDNAQWNNETNTYDPCIDPAQIIAQYKKVKAKDPSHPYYLNLGQGVSYTNWIGRGECRGATDQYAIANNGYLKGCDIVSFDIYPVNSEDQNVKDKLWMGAKGIDSLRVWGNDSKPVWTWIETTKIDKNSPRKPTPGEVKTQVWMALIHGAKGIGYFCHSFDPEPDDAALLHDQAMLEAVNAINRQITQLAPVLNSQTQTNYAEVKSSNLNGPIDILSKNHKDINYLFAVGMRNEPTQATFKVNSGHKAEVIGENRTIKIINGQFEDQFGGYEVHLYKIR